LAAEREDEVKELVSKLHHERMDGIWKNDMLQHLIQQQADLRPDDVGLNDVNGKSGSYVSLCGRFLLCSSVLLCDFYFTSPVVTVDASYLTASSSAL